MITCPKCQVAYEPETPCQNQPYHYHCPSCSERSDGVENELTNNVKEGEI